jgi:hypothetical protein
VLLPPTLLQQLPQLVLLAADLCGAGLLLLLLAGLAVQQAGS